jgi:PAS domain-containing protein
MTPYSEEIERLMQTYYRTLSEKDRRRYAAIEAKKLGHGGITYIAQVLDCAQSTVATGLQELATMPAEVGYEARLRRPGGGRKSYQETIPGIDDAFLAVVATHTAGDPMQVNVQWTDLTRRQIAERLQQDHGIVVSDTVVKQLLKKHNFRRRKAQKK